MNPRAEAGPTPPPVRRQGGRGGEGVGDRRPPGGTGGQGPYIGAMKMATTNVVDKPLSPAEETKLITQILEEAKARADGAPPKLRDRLVKIQTARPADTVAKIVGDYVSHKSIGATARTMRRYLIVGGKRMAEIDKAAQDLVEAGGFTSAWTMVSDVMADALIKTPTHKAKDLIQAAKDSKLYVGPLAISKATQEKAIDAVKGEIPNRTDLSDADRKKAVQLIQALRSILVHPKAAPKAKTATQEEEVSDAA